MPTWSNRTASLVAPRPHRRRGPSPSWQGNRGRVHVAQRRARVGDTAPVKSPQMILENGIVRTLEPSLPVARALAIAGDRIAGGVGVHETALASPEVVDLRGRCVLPGFNDAHVHFPTWSLAQRQVRLEGARSLDETLERVAEAVRGAKPGAWLRGHGWRSGDWRP